MPLDSPWATSYSTSIVPNICHRFWNIWPQILMTLNYTVQGHPIDSPGSVSYSTPSWYLSPFSRYLTLKLFFIRMQAKKWAKLEVNWSACKLNTLVLLAIKLTLLRQMCNLHFKFEEHWIKTAVAIESDRYFRQTDKFIQINPQVILCLSRQTITRRTIYFSYVPSSSH